MTMTLHRANQMKTDIAYAVTENRVGNFDVIFTINNEDKIVINYQFLQSNICRFDVKLDNTYISDSGYQQRSGVLFSFV